MPAAFQNPCEIEHCDFDQGDNVEFHAYLGYSEEASEGYAVALDDDFLEDQKLVSVDSFSVFCREADLRAHSSELELSVNDSKQVPDANTIARMSSTELTSTIQMHARALASLLRENNERMKLHQSVASAGNADADVAGDHAEFVAGSFRNKDFCPHPTRSTRDTSSNQLNTTSEISFLS